MYTYSTRFYVVSITKWSSYSESRLTSSSRYLPSPHPHTLASCYSVRFVLSSSHHYQCLCLYTQTQQVGFTRKRAQRARPCCKSKLGNVALDIDRFNHCVAVKFLVIYPYNVLFLYNQLWLSVKSLLLLLCTVLDKLLNKVTKL